MKDKTNEWTYTTGVIRQLENKMGNIEHKEDGDKWTNATIRKLLGEKGWIEQKDLTTYQQNPFPATQSIWTRGIETIALEESESSEPVLFDMSTGIIDPKDLVNRNDIIQNDGSSDE